MHQQVLHRAYSLVSVKGFDPQTRMFAGIATSPVADRMGDTIASDGVQFKNPLPLLLYHDSHKPVGEARFSSYRQDGTPFTAQISSIDRDGVVKQRLDEAVDSLNAKPPLIRGVSIGFRPLESPVLNKEGGFHFPKIEVLELSMVVIPAHQDATIDLVKSLDVGAPAATGTATNIVTNNTFVNNSTSGVTDIPVVALATTHKDVRMKTITEQISGFEATRQAKSARMLEMMTKAADDGVTLDQEQGDEYDTLESEVKAIDVHLARLRTAEEANKKAAKPVAGTSLDEGTRARAGLSVSVQERTEPGIGFARYAICKMAAYLSHGEKRASEFAQERYPHDTRLQTLFTKTNVAGGTTTDSTWAGPLVDPTNLVSEFIEYLRPRTIIGQFGMNGIPSLHDVPFNVRVLGQTSGGSAWWVGQGKPKPVTKFDFEATNLGFAKVANIAVISDELARFSTPSAERLVRNALAAAVIEKIDITFIDPDVAAVANVSPASITNGITPISTSGTDAAAVRRDIQALWNTFILDNQDPTNAVYIMPATVALALSLMVNDLGQPEFPGLTMRGGTFNGIPVIVSQYAAWTSPDVNIVALVNADEIFLSDDGQVTVDASREASLEMLDNPTNSIAPVATSMVSLWQTNSIGLKAERYINWARRRTTAVAWLQDVEWGSAGSPV